MDYGINDLWPTKVLLDKMSNLDLVDEVSTAILNDVDIIQKSNDFQVYDVLRDGGDVFKKFQKEIVEPMFDSYLRSSTGQGIKEFAPYKFRSWITGTAQGYMIPTHNHSGASVSGVFYLISEEVNLGGELHIMDPRSNANRGYQKLFKPWFAEQVLTPKTGDAILFPSFVYHYTLPFMGRMRLGMAVDFYQE